MLTPGELRPGTLVRIPPAAWHALLQHRLGVTTAPPQNKWVRVRLLGHPSVLAYRVAQLEYGPEVIAAHVAWKMGVRE